MEQSYLIEDLAHIFGKHADLFDEQCKKYRTEKPDVDYPPDDFNLAKALSVICWEIEKLKTCK